MPAPWEALEALRLAADGVDWPQGLDYERQATARLAGHPAFHNLLNLRLERERHRARAPKPESVRYLRSIGVVGATAAGLAFVQQALLRAARSSCKTATRPLWAMHRSSCTSDYAGGGQARNRVAAAALNAWAGPRHGRVEHFDELDLILDTLEDGRRAERFRHLDEIATPATILASTGAADTARQLQEGLRHPRRVAVMHFAGPSGRRRSPNWPMPTIPPSRC